MSQETPATPEYSVADIDQRHFELWEKHDESPVTEQVWREVIELAETEEGSDISKRGTVGDISPQALIELSTKVRNEPDPIKRYEQVTQLAPNGKLWFDVLVGFSASETENVLYDVLDNHHWGSVLDLGTGTGRAGGKIAPLCDQVIGIDRVETILNVAQTKVDFSLINADVTALPIKDQSMDLVVSGGLTGAMKASSQRKFWSEVGRVLKPGGVFVEVFYMTPQDQSIHPVDVRHAISAKAILADMIVDAVSGKMLPGDHLDSDQKAQVLQQSGLDPDIRLDPISGYGAQIMHKL